MQEENVEPIEEVKEEPKKKVKTLQEELESKPSLLEQLPNKEALLT